MDSASQSPPSSLSNPPAGVATRRGKSFAQLSSHGMPKTPYSPEGSVRPHRFSTTGSPPQLASPPITPMPPMSPPMSAKSFGTIIDSAPSTPAYSPRMGSAWDGSTLVVLSPVSSASSGPPEPQWDMVAPTPRPKLPSNKSASPSLLQNEMTAARFVEWKPVTSILDVRRREDSPPREKDEPVEAELEKKTPEEQPTHVAPLEKLATRMKSMLRRRSGSEKKSAGESKTEKRRKRNQELDYMEDVHWTEM